MVAFVVGGSGFKSAELYSPNGNCSYQLADVPTLSTAVESPVLGILDGKIICCDSQFTGYQKCWNYNINNNTWSLYTTSSFVHYSPGIFYNELLYVVDSLHPEVFDPMTKTWSAWSVTLSDPQGSCLVIWQGQVKLK